MQCLVQIIQCIVARGVEECSTGHCFSSIAMSHATPAPPLHIQWGSQACSLPDASLVRLPSNPFLPQVQSRVLLFLLLLLLALLKATPVCRV